MYDDIDGFGDNVQIVKKTIMGDIMNEVVLPDKTIQKIDLGLEKIMKNGNGAATKKKSKKEQQAEADEDTEEYDDDYDGNEWDD